MGILNWLFKWRPEKYKWYAFYDVRKSYYDWTNALNRFKHYDALKVAPFAYIKGKRHWARFYVTEKYCEITTRKHKIIVPLKRCLFRKKINTYFQGQSHVTEYYITVVAKHVVEEDYRRYNTRHKNRKMMRRV